MKFIDEIEISVIAGNGGSGCVSFQKNKTRTLNRKVPNGGDGGKGGDIYLVSDKDMNDLTYYHYHRTIRAENGKNGRSYLRKGKKGKDMIEKVPVGTKVFDEKKNMIMDLKFHNQSIKVAVGGSFGLGNHRFRTKRSDRFTEGKYGDKKKIFLELNMIADVGLLGMPNSGKSSLIRQISSAKPKVADYPFTTLFPHLGVVRTEKRSFIVADIPGLIDGASKGIGLGIRFLKHLERCSILLHVVDISQEDTRSPIERIKTIDSEIISYKKSLFEKERWIVFNKIDLLDEKFYKKTVDEIVQKISWKKKYYSISAIKKIGLKNLCRDIADYISSERTISC
ncbi:Obg family GTPase CgtA [Candidatus Riesia pediculicola]|uniref:GTPase Obg n=1 Tax=Riesia pediculicola (strain USDA) TaxID=515618 RepID=D4G876_RIEPU|nr:Obg family GTPase CgtA [Candidatus Riesia pediculicola]ADD79819.1 GTP-binding protein Obg/CgtA [Candidatus Riesia pediculicola USDA]ARC53776.1 GTPase CgtA [Candidatus Riesia pediculicola]QOJ86414.1 Obg family GTPase CgtA [Candidatus Riesia pediculicola]